MNIFKCTNHFTLNLCLIRINFTKSFSLKSILIITAEPNIDKWTHVPLKISSKEKGKHIITTKKQKRKLKQDSHPTVN